MNIKCRSLYIFVLAGLLLLQIMAMPLGAQENSAGTSGKFQMITKDDGIVRLNIQTGKTSFCRTVNGNLVCSLATEERDVLESEIAKLQKQIAKLEENPKSKNGEQMLNSEQNAQKNGAPQSESDKEFDRQFDKLDKELGRALDLTKRTFRRFFDAVKDLQSDLSNS